MLPEVIIENKIYSAPTWKQMGEMTVALAEKIKKENIKFDRLIAIAGGGLGWAKQLQDLLQIPRLSSIEVKYYLGINKTKNNPTLTQPLSISVKNEKILLYDDVVDSGETIKFAKEYLTKSGTKSIYTATHFLKPHTETKPDFSVHKTNVWIIFPHDTLEMIGLLKKEWSNMDKEQIKSSLKQIGIEDRIIHFALRSKA